jgi:hypothetical protein
MSSSRQVDLLEEDFKIQGHFGEIWEELNSSRKEELILSMIFSVNLRTSSTWAGKDNSSEVQARDSRRKARTSYFKWR